MDLSLKHSKELASKDSTRSAHGISPDAEDDLGHDCYQAIRSGDVSRVHNLLQCPIERWQGNSMTLKPQLLTELIRKSYSEINLKNVFLNFDMRSFIERTLIDLCFFSDEPIEGEEAANNSSGTLTYDLALERIRMVLDDVEHLKRYRENGSEADSMFLYVSKCIACNIHVLKQRLKSTYDRIPWEEMEFCIVGFIISRTKRDEVNLNLGPVLNACSLLDHLEKFSLCLEELDVNESEKSKLTMLPGKPRDKIAEDIVQKHPKLLQLYADFASARDVYSLEKMRRYISPATLASSTEKEGQLVISRALQVIGEHMKNTLQSPKLSYDTVNDIRRYLPPDTVKVVQKARDELSHPPRSNEMEEVEENDDKFFVGIQEDLKKIGNAILHFYYLKKIRALVKHLKHFAETENMDPLKCIFETLGDIESEELISEGYKLSMERNIQELIEDFSSMVMDDKAYEKDLNEMRRKIKLKRNVGDVKANFVQAFNFLRDFFKIIGKAELNREWLIEMKEKANEILMKLDPLAGSQVKVEELKEIADKAEGIYSSVLRKGHHQLTITQIERVKSEIIRLTDILRGDMKYVKEYIGKLTKSKPPRNFNDVDPVPNLNRKLNMLGNVLNGNVVSFESTHFPNRPKDATNTLLLALEKLLLDILSILGEKMKRLPLNQNFLDETFPLLTGRCLRNHLAHDNAIVETMQFDLSLATLGNAEKLVKENHDLHSKTIGKLVKDDPKKLKDRYKEDRDLIAEQDNLFCAIEKREFRKLSGCLKKVDILARDVNSWTALHYAAKGTSLEIVKHFLNKNSDLASMTDIKGQSALHVSAAFGRKGIVEHFVKENIIPVDAVDNDGKTPLHVASLNGHLDVVKVLLENEADVSKKDKWDSCPLHYATRNNHMKVVQCLNEHDESQQVVKQILNSKFMV